MANNPKGKRNKALYIVLIILIIVLAGVLIYYFVFAEKGQNKEQDIETTEEVTDEIDTSDWETYMSEEYGFSFKYPEGWEKILKKEMPIPEGSKIYKIIRIYSENDSDKYFQIQIVKVKDKNDLSVIDYPQTFITEDDKYAFYYTGGGDCVGMPGCDGEKYLNIQLRVGKISRTFEIKK